MLYTKTEVLIFTRCTAHIHWLKNGNLIDTTFEQIQGCKIDEQESLGLTPIALAAYYRNSKTTEYLLSVGADPFVADKYGITSALRMANTMPTMIRDVFQTLVSEDLYQGSYIRRSVQTV